jgi:N-acetylglucosamine kinase-like BadF-type ATPase
MTVRLLGIDAGGTSLTAVLTDDGRVVARTREPAMNALLDADVTTRVTELLHRFDPDAAVLGLAGVRSSRHAHLIQSGIDSATDKPVLVTDDALIALAAAFHDAPGIVVSAGTGTFAIARDRTDSVHRLGGHGYLIGDEGGGYWIGRRLVAAALRSATGAGEHSPEVEELVFTTFGGGPGHVEATVYRQPTNRLQFSRLAAAAGTMDDPMVNSIFDAAARELVTLTRAVRKRVPDVPVVFIGGLSRCPRLADRVRRDTGAMIGDCEPAQGAAGLAGHLLRPASHTSTKQLARWRTSFPSDG